VFPLVVIRPATISVRTNSLFVAATSVVRGGFSYAS
jgi:hypothetical protein